VCWWRARVLEVRSCAGGAPVCSFSTHSCAGGAPVCSVTIHSCARGAPVCLETTHACAHGAPVCLETTHSCADCAPVCLETTHSCADCAPVCSFSLHSCAALVCLETACALVCSFALGAFTLRCPKGNPHERREEEGVVGGRLGGRGPQRHAEAAQEVGVRGFVKRRCLRERD
jgi:hypothetical protein